VKALTKSQIAAAQRHFGIDAKVAAEVDDGEEEIAQFGFNLGITRWTAWLMLGRGNFGFELCGFLNELGQEIAPVGPIKAGLCCF
jgi:hypothetical protein